MRRDSFVFLLALLTAAAGRDEAGLPSGGRAYLAHCAVCHGVEGNGDGPLAASIRAEGKTPPARLDRARVTALGVAGIRAAIESGAHRRGAVMPMWGPHLGSEWIERISQSVVAAIRDSAAHHAAVERDLAAPPGTPPAGRRVYVLYCSGCHGPDGGGNGFLSEPNARRLAVASLRTAEIARLDGRGFARLIGPEGSHAPDAATMPGWLHTIAPDERKDLLGYLKSLAPPH